MPLIIFLAALLACNNGGSAFPDTCTLPTPVPESGSHPGESVWIVAAAMTTLNDTIVTVGAVQAELLAVDRAGCDALDTCRSDNACAACADCDVCADDAATCIERVRITTPALAPGAHALSVQNAFGASGTGTLEILGGDTGSCDSADCGDSGDTADSGDSGGGDTGGDSGDTAGDTGGDSGDSGGTDTGGDSGGTDTGGDSGDTGSGDTGAEDVDPPALFCAP